MKYLKVLMFLQIVAFILVSMDGQLVTCMWIFATFVGCILINEQQKAIELLAETIKTQRVVIRRRNR